MNWTRIVCILAVALGTAGCPVDQEETCLRTCRAEQDCGITQDVATCVATCTDDIDALGLQDQLDRVEDCAVFHLYAGECAPEAFDICLAEIPGQSASDHIFEMVDEVCDVMDACCPDRDFRISNNKCSNLRQDNREDGIKDAVQQGLIRFDHVAADTCRADVRSTLARTTCEDRVALDATTMAWDASPACAAVYTGLVEQGGSCIVSNSYRSIVVSQACAEGLQCAVQGDGSATCEEVSPEGLMCEVDNDCAVGFACDGATQTCRPLGFEGDSCGVDSDCRQGVCAEGVCLDTPVCDAW